jgi:hypothetical protein
VSPVKRKDQSSQDRSDEPVAVCTRAMSSARPASAVRSTTCGRLSLENTLLERLAQDLEDMAAALGPCIQAAHAVVGQRRLARPRPVAPADQPSVRDGVVGGSARARGESDAVAGAAGDARDAGGIDRCDQAR